MKYPIELFKMLSSGEIDRNQFIKWLENWQKINTVDFSCRGVAFPNLVGVMYRGRNAIIKNGQIKWLIGKRGKKDIRDSAKSVFEFKRKVDFAICKGFYD